MSKTQQLLTFLLDDETYGLNIQRVQEVLEFTSTTTIPQMPDYMIGVINLRGHVVPVVNMRKKFGMQDVARTVNTCIIIVEIQKNKTTIVMGALVDSVREVMTLESDQIEPPPEMENPQQTAFLHGMGKQDDQFVLILDVDQVFSTVGFEPVEEISPKTAVDV